MLLDRDTAPSADLLDTTAEALALAKRLATRGLGTRNDVAHTLLPFAEARALARRDLPAGQAAVETLLSDYREEAKATGLLESATALQRQLTDR